VIGMKRIFCVLAGAVLLGGCSGDYSDLDTWMAEVDARPHGAIEPIPVFKPYETFIYSAQSLRAPFDKPLPPDEGQVKTGEEVKPDLLRPKEFLERFTFEQLAMVGTLSQNGALWALVADGAGGVHRVRVGNYLGKDHGKIVETTETSISVQEIVPSGQPGSWIARPRSIKLAEQ
jgi:type IV pilus assembly protein PilP